LYIGDIRAYIKSDTLLWLLPVMWSGEDRYMTHHVRNGILIPYFRKRQVDYFPTDE
jgi:hypothetical protein